MKRGIIFLLAAFLITGVKAQKTINDPNAVSRTVSGFHAIDISNSFDVYVFQGNEEGLAVSASEQGYIDKIKTTVENGVLVIKFDNQKNWKGWKNGKMKLKAYIAVKNLDKLTVSGACDVYIEDGIRSENLTINASGASDVKGVVNVNKLTIDMSGASDLFLKGKATELNVDASGASDFKSYDLITDFCNVKASGASSISITVNKELSAQASGASDINYKGEGLMRDIKSSGASSVSRKS